MYFAIDSKYPFENMKLIFFKIFLSPPWNKMLFFFHFWHVETWVYHSSFGKDSVQRLVLEANFVFFWKIIEYRWHLLMVFDLFCQRFKPKAVDFLHLPFKLIINIKNEKESIIIFTIISFSLYFITHLFFKKLIKLVLTNTYLENTFKNIIVESTIIKDKISIDFSSKVDIFHRFYHAFNTN